MKQSFGKGVFKGAAVVAGFSGVAKAMAFVQKLAVAARFGTGVEADAFAVAFNSIVYGVSIIPMKILAPFLPLFAERREKEGEPAAWRFASSVGNLLALALTVVVLAGIAIAPYLVRAAANFSDPETTRLTVTLTRIMFPAAFFVGLYAFATLVFHSDKRFALPALGDSLNRLVVIVCMFALYRFCGIRGLAIGIVAGALLALTLLLAGLRSKLSLLRPAIDWHDPMLRTLIVLMPPVIVSILIAQARTVLDYRFASGMGEGFAASLNYAKGFTDTMTTLVPFAVGIVIYPFFADLTAEGDKEKMTDALMASLRGMAFVFVPLSVALIVLRVPVVQLVFQRGQFAASSLALTTGPLLYYALGMTAFALEIIIMRFYFSLKNTWTPAWVGVVCVVLHVSVILALRDVMQHRSIALAATVSKTAKVLVLFLLLRPKLSSLRWGENFGFAAKMLLAVLLMALTLHFVFGGVCRFAPVPLHAAKSIGTAYLAAQMGLATAASLAVFGVTTFVLRVKEAETVWAVCRKLWRRNS
jgi:putative peptidoglycan lipid II flippase